ncbi:MAG: TetR/AcrR family transcriptional regulator [Desulfobacter sp.]|nr:MAG: TetR/AcrR family transcriptional regulator [Desulfobacter sp.]
MGISDRKERDFRRREEAILRAAFDLFAEKGIDAATIEMIAEKAEVGKGTIYKHFTGKNDIFASIVITHGKELLSTLKGMDRSLPVMARIETMIRIFWDAHTRDMQVFEVIRNCHRLMTVDTLPPEILAQYNRLQELKKTFVRELFQQAINERIFKDADVENMIVASMGLYTGMLDVTLEEDIRPTEELYDILKNMIFKGFMR